MYTLTKTTIYPRTTAARLLAWTPLAGHVRSKLARAEAAQAERLHRMEHGTAAYWRAVDRYDDIADAVCVLTFKGA